jgi:hypothetical protein
MSTLQSSLKIYNYYIYKLKKKCFLYFSKKCNSMLPNIYKLKFLTTVRNLCTTEKQDVSPLQNEELKKNCISKEVEKASL